MVKKRSDLQVDGARIIAAIRAGRAQVIPVDPPEFNGSATFGKKVPSVFILTKSLRLRLPPVSQKDRSRYMKRTGKSWDNRMTIPPSVLNSRLVIISPTAPDYEALLKMSIPNREVLGVYTKNGIMRRRIFEIVEDYSHSLRQPGHIKNQYDTDLESLEKTKLELQDKLSQHRSGLSRLVPSDVANISTELNKILVRIAEVTHIYQDRIARERRMQQYTTQAIHRLYYLKMSLLTFAGRFGKNRPVAVRPAIVYLEDLDKQLQFFTSKEIRHEIRRARYHIALVVMGLGNASDTMITGWLRGAVSSLENAAHILENWSQTEKAA